MAEHAITCADELAAADTVAIAVMSRHVIPRRMAITPDICRKVLGHLKSHSTHCECCLCECADTAFDKDASDAAKARELPYTKAIARQVVNTR